ncbi:hypothetical protein [Spirosoma linguale]|uniref:Uncharacterized protein n=1 Tax=Spirosoma linguale (strain ATCC 33905 / DSM 74 / LMG 10896 / Claus 1) TaxID=504472 RepID=D2QPK0_SPILD|nr:conserved hypothetical protein [Spirosoma linguale DSM 74]
MVLSDKAVDYLEQQIPELVSIATRQAYWQTLASGDSVLVAENGQIIEVKPDGSRTYVKTVDKPKAVTQKHFRIPKA